MDKIQAEAICELIVSDINGGKISPRDAWIKHLLPLQSQPPAKPDPKGDALEADLLASHIMDTAKIANGEWTVEGQAEARRLILAHDAALLASSQGQSWPERLADLCRKAEVLKDTEWRDGYLAAINDLGRPVASKQGQGDCAKCDGKGYTAEHSSVLGDHDGDGNCLGACPVQVQCEACNGTGIAHPQPSGLREADWDKIDEQFEQVAATVHADNPGESYERSAYRDGGRWMMHLVKEQLRRAALAQADRESQG